MPEALEVSFRSFGANLARSAAWLLLPRGRCDAFQPRAASALRTGWYKTGRVMSPYLAASVVFTGSGFAHVTRLGQSEVLKRIVYSSALQNSVVPRGSVRPFNSLALTV